MSCKGGVNRPGNASSTSVSNDHTSVGELVYCCSHYTVTIQSLYSHHKVTIQLLYSHHTVTIQLLYSHVLLQSLYSHYTVTIQSLYSHYTVTIQSPYSYYTVTYCCSHYTVTIQSLYSHVLLQSPVRHNSISRPDSFSFTNGLVIQNVKNQNQYRG